MLMNGTCALSTVQLVVRVILGLMRLSSMRASSGTEDSEVKEGVPENYIHTLLVVVLSDVVKLSTTDFDAISVIRRDCNSNLYKDNPSQVFPQKYL